MFRLHFTYMYTTENLAIVRNLYNLPVCYKVSFNFLKGQHSTSRNLSNRLALKSNFKKSYKQLIQFYTARLKKFFLKVSYIDKALYGYDISNTDLTYFLRAHKQFKSINSLERALLWRATQIGSIFKLNYQEKRKQKQYFYRSRVSFVQRSKRILTVWSWLNTFIKSFLIKNTHWGVCLGPSLDNFLFTLPPTHILTDMKLHVYKIQLLRTL